ncbi:MAG: ribosome biogenesis GTP-binding protein YihA/YsxC [Gracilibacteraceae bacterium]|nr:ribosome biogenesis GTP-binding protein YihA/YsxC [Gracilibacteraceae bacterium]
MKTEDGALVRRAEFLTSAVRPEQYPPPDRPEIAVCGRSNCGKSTLINKILHRRGLAKTGKTPGKTRLINFFSVDGEWYFVDLPGYGFAKVARATQAAWGRMMSVYFSGRKNLRGVVQLVDIRHEPTEADAAMLNMLRERGLPALVVATKADKIARGARARQLGLLARKLMIDDPGLILPFSALDGTGQEELRAEIVAFLQDPSFGETGP